jgi:hypothetical protein
MEQLDSLQTTGSGSARAENETKLARQNQKQDKRGQ